MEPRFLCVLLGGEEETEPLKEKARGKGLFCFVFVSHCPNLFLIGNKLKLPQVKSVLTVPVISEQPPCLYLDARAFLSDFLRCPAEEGERAAGWATGSQLWSDHSTVEGCASTAIFGQPWCCLHLSTYRNMPGKPWLPPGRGRQCPKPLCEAVSHSVRCSALCGAQPTRR